MWGQAISLLSKGAVLLWILNVLLLCILLYQSVLIVGARTPEKRKRRGDWLREGLRKLDGRPTASAIVNAYPPSIDFRRSIGPAVALLSSISESELERLREICQDTVNHVNKCAELADRGLLSPKDIAQRRPEIHRDLLIELTLIEPFVWHESLACGRGRWGYRPLALRDALGELRYGSHSRKVLSPLKITTRGGHNVLLAAEVAGWRRLVWRNINLLRSNTITERRKVRQKRYHDRLRSELIHAGVRLPMPTHDLW